MSAIGPQAGDPDVQHEQIPVCAQPVNLAGDVNMNTLFTCGFATELYVGTGGNVVAQLISDAAPQTYVGVPSGSFLHGMWILVRSTTNGTTASNIVARR